MRDIKEIEKDIKEARKEIAQATARFECAEDELVAWSNKLDGLRAELRQARKGEGHD